MNRIDQHDGDGRDDRKDRDDRDFTLEALLREIVRKGHRSELPPDLRDSIVQRLQRDEARFAAERVRRASRTPLRATSTWLLAAALLLGTSVVVATWWLRPAPDAARPAAAPEATPAAPRDATLIAAQDPKAQDPKAQAPKTNDSKVQDPRPPDPTGKGPQLQGDRGFELRVRDQHGGPVAAFEVDVVRVSDAGALSRVPGFKTRVVSPRDVRDEAATIDALPAGKYVAIVRADAHAQTCSQPFELAADAPRPKITVQLDRGGTLRGVVQSADGKPLAGVRVRTAAPAPVTPGVPRYSSLAEILAPMRVTLQTVAEVVTDANGAWQLRWLSAGEYEVHVEHSEHCVELLEHVAVTAAAQDLGVTKLRRGTRVHGRALEGENGVAGVEVTMTSADEAAPQTWRATTDAEGKFTMPQRVPPGRYRLHGKPPAKPGGNPFEVLAAIQKSQRWIDVAGGDTLEQDVTVSR